MNNNKRFLQCICIYHKPYEKQLEKQDTFSLSDGSAAAKSQVTTEEVDGPVVGPGVAVWGEVLQSFYCIGLSYLYILVKQ